MATNRRRVWTLFVSNIADRLHWQRVWQVFDWHGEVVDVFVPARKSKAGERFGFVQMASREAADRVIERLHGRWIYGSRISVSFAVRGGCEESWQWRQERAGYDRYSGDGITVLDNRGIGGDYRESTMGVHVKQALKNVQGVVTEDKREVLHTCAVAWCRGSLRGKALVEALHSANMKGCSVMRISGDAVLLMFETVEDRQAVLDRPDLEKWFLKVVAWSPKVRIDRRWVWLSLVGLSMHLWSTTTFTNIAHLWGQLVRLEDSTQEPTSFERARCLVETSRMAHIGEMVEVRGREEDEVWRVWVQEVEQAEGVFRENPLFTDKSPAKVVGFHDDQRGSRGMGDVEVGVISRVEASEWCVWDVDAVVEFEMGTQVRSGPEMKLGQLGENAGGQGPLTVVEGEWDSNSIQQNQVVLFKSNILGESVAEDNEKESVSIHEKEVSSAGNQFSNSKIQQPSVIITGPNTAGSQQLLEVEIVKRNKRGRSRKNEGQDIPYANASLSDSDFVARQTALLNEAEATVELGRWCREKEGVRDFVRKQRCDMVFILESKLEVVSDVVVGSLWATDSFEFVFAPSLGALGGIIIIWDSTRFVIESSDLLPHVIRTISVEDPVEKELGEQDNSGFELKEDKQRGEAIVEDRLSSSEIEEKSIEAQRLFFPEVESNRQRRKRYGLLSSFQDKVISESDKKKWDRAIRREKKKVEGWVTSELSGRSLSDSDLAYHWKLPLKEAKGALSLWKKIWVYKLKVLRKRRLKS
ncbi:hypothetical protein GQ457_05G026620 [Hibiscus cannabinus]